MRFRVQVVRLSDDGAEQTKAVTEFTRQELVMETLGMTLGEGMAALEGVQEFVTERQAAGFLRQARICQRCGRSCAMKSGGATTNVRTVYGWPPDYPRPCGALDTYGCPSFSQLVCIFVTTFASSACTLGPSMSCGKVGRS